MSPAQSPVSTTLCAWYGVRIANNDFHFAGFLLREKAKKMSFSGNLKARVLQQARVKKQNHIHIHIQSKKCEESPASALESFLNSPFAYWSEKIHSNTDRQRFRRSDYLTIRRCNVRPVMTMISILVKNRFEKIKCTIGQNEQQKQRQQINWITVHEQVVRKYGFLLQPIRLPQPSEMSHICFDSADDGQLNRCQTLSNGMVSCSSRHFHPSAKNQKVTLTGQK